MSNNRSELYKNAINSARKEKIPLEDILIENSTYTHGASLKKRLIEANLKTLVCERCGVTEWLGQPVPLQLHHKNGNHTDNRLENLELLCPNCHALTDTYTGKNIKIHKTNKPKKQKSKIQIGISKDGQRLYDKNGNYKALCPKCKENFMSKSSLMCRKCYDKERLKPAASKERLFEVINQTKSYYSAADLLGVGRNTVSRWHKYYVNEENKNNNEVKLIGSDKAPSRDVLKTKIRTMSFVKIGEEYNVTDNSVRKWCDAYNLPRHKAKIKKYSDEEWELI